MLGEEEQSVPSGSNFSRLEALQKLSGQQMELDNLKPSYIRLKKYPIDNELLLLNELIRDRGFVK
jgi:hypothetical protein